MREARAGLQSEAPPRSNPDRPGAILIVGHQPTLGRVAATLLSGAQADWHMAKGAVWWLRHVEGETKLFAVVHPKLA